MIARAGAHFEHFLVSLQPERFGHSGHDVGLRDGLAFADGEGMVFISLREVLWVHELVSRDFQEGLEHARVADVAAAQLPFHHLGAPLGQVRFSQTHPSPKIITSCAGRHEAASGGL